MPPDFSEAVRIRVNNPMLQGSLEHCTLVGNHGYVCKDKKCIETQRPKTQEYGKRLQVQNSAYVKLIIHKMRAPQRWFLEVCTLTLINQIPGLFSSPASIKYSREI